MKFENILSTFVRDNKLNVSLIDENSTTSDHLLREAYLLEAKKAKAELYKDLTIQQNTTAITAEDVANIKFYEKGKNAKEGKTPEQISTLNTKQAELFNKIVDKVKEDSKNSKTTLVELTAATVKVFRDVGQNSPTANYNLRGVVEVLINRKEILQATNGTKVNIDAVTVAPQSLQNIDTSTLPDTEEDETAEEVSADSSSASKFDSAVSKNEPEIKKESGSSNYFRVEKNARIQREDMADRAGRIACNYLLDTIREELPGFYNMQSLIAKANEEEAGLTDEEAKSWIKQLVKLGKITLVPKGTEEDAVPDAEDDDTPTGSRSTSDAPEDIVDRQLTGSTRKGFNFDAFDL